jgi:hypothetical protein
MRPRNVEEATAWDKVPDLIGAPQTGIGADSAAARHRMKGIALNAQIKKGQP